MALVFKIKHGDTLRRWVVSESVNTEMFPVTLDQLHAKVRELFQFPASTALAITYVDKENDVVTLGDDRDLVDACLVQRLNPLRLEVQVLESKSTGTDRANQPAGDLNVEGFLKLLFPNATAEALQSFLQRYAQSLDPSLPIATLILKAQDAFKEFMAHAAKAECCKPAPSDKHAHHHPYKHPFGDARGKSMPHKGEHGSKWKDFSGFPSFHLGVQCDGCGATPIQGTRYTSNKVPDYDLCSSCYQEKGKEEDYDKIEHPVFPPNFHDRLYRPPCLRKGLKQFMGQQSMRPPMGGRGFFGRGPYGWRPENAFGHNEHKKLDARFVKDVTIFDGTELAPGTKFTKIWRMSNNGSLSWPYNTQLLHIGGDVLCLQEAVNVELPEDGLGCGEEVEVSVDLTAPEKAGRYISHWRLVSPEAQKFGQRVWVTIQVVPQGEQSPLLQESLKDGGEEILMGQESLKETNNTSVPATISRSIIDVPIASKAEAEKEAGFNIDEVPITRKDEAQKEAAFDINAERESMVDDVPITFKDEAEKEAAFNADVERPSKVENVSGSSVPDTHLSQEVKITEMVPDISQELEGFSIVEKPLVEFGDEEMMESTENVNMGREDESLKLQSLESMGFVDQELNAVLLKKNNGDLQLTVDDLLVAAGCDGAVEDLQEMGFTDRATNVRLLMKHKGNLKAAVRELVMLGKQKA